MGTDAMKAKIMSHPLYPALLRAFIDCQKVGAPPEVVGRLSSLADDLKSNSDDVLEQPADPELDQFMETYCVMLVRYSQELTRQIQEADHFFRNMEAHISTSALGDNCEGEASTEDEQEIGDVGGLPVQAAELKDQFLNKHNGYLSSLWRKLSKKKTKGKLPSGARQKLQQWWRLNWRSPYPSELEKAALAESTGLDRKQINNWFINQRKRHWKPTPPAVEYRSQQQTLYGASSSSSAAFLTEGHYFTRGSA
ncbi:hypothetical protein BRADI_1g12677v3 [Brachypodium distachyon]|uniref:Homeobox domain-containing protein n=1 Tax=Brachypodium distachyon TaxID=15368 RepID=I1GPN4_BRADI|nr:hypothetical protein BRADI_1g12677v3 [Brachypodium distachyon]